MPAYFLRAKWKNLIMANYAVDPALLMPYLPPGTELDFYQGKTYLSLVGFLFANSRIFGFPIPQVGTFEEINLRFYVIRREGKSVKRGVVFIREFVPYKSVANIANRFYHEHYEVSPTHHVWTKNVHEKQISYLWRKAGRWNILKVHAASQPEPMPFGSFEEFIFEHYWGFVKRSETETVMYQVEHPRWMIHPVQQQEIDCRFGAIYGEAFSVLDGQAPHSVMLARGSDVLVPWKRTRIISP